MKKLFKTVAAIAAIGAVIGGVIYFFKKQELEDIDDLDDLEDFDDFDDFDDELEEDVIDRVYTSIHLDGDDVEEVVEEL